MSSDATARHLVPNERGLKIVIVGWTLGALATALTMGRVYMRLKLSRDDGWAVFWAVSAWAPAIVTTCLVTLTVIHGMGQHLEIVYEAGQAGSFAVYAWWCILIHQIAIPIGKIAVASFMLALQARTSLRTRYLLHFIAISNVVVHVPFILITLLECDPPSALWDPTNQQACDHTWGTHYGFFTGTWASLSDFTMAALPAWLFWNLQVSLKLKLGLSLLTGLGVFAGVAAVIKTVEVGKVPGIDASWNWGDLIIWATAEMWIVLIALNLPPNLPFFKWLSGLLVSSTSTLLDYTKDVLRLSAKNGTTESRSNIRACNNSAYNLGEPHLYPDRVDLGKAHCRVFVDGEGWVDLSVLERERSADEESFH